MAASQIEHSSNVHAPHATRRAPTLHKTPAKGILQRYELSGQSREQTQVGKGRLGEHTGTTNKRQAGRGLILLLHYIWYENPAREGKANHMVGARVAQRASKFTLSPQRVPGQPQPWGHASAGTANHRKFGQYTKRSHNGRLEAMTHVGSGITRGPGSRGLDRTEQPGR
jgi:hypothetical protein